MAKRKCVRRKTVRIKGHTRRVCASYGAKRKKSSGGSKRRCRVKSGPKKGRFTKCR